MNKRFPILIFKFLWISTYVSGGIVTLVLAILIESNWGIFIAIALGGWCMLGAVHWRRLFLVGKDAGSDYVWVSPANIDDDEG